MTDSVDQQRPNAAAMNETLDLAQARRKLNVIMGRIIDNTPHRNRKAKDLLGAVTEAFDLVVESNSGENREGCLRKLGPIFARIAELSHQSSDRLTVDRDINQALAVLRQAGMLASTVDATETAEVA